MLGRTHFTIGALVGTALSMNSPGLGMLEGAAIGGIAGLMADFDHPNSMISHRVVPISLGSRRISLALLSIGVIYLGYRGWLPLGSIIVIALWLLTAALSPHRGLTHSILGAFWATYGLSAWLGDKWIIFAVGYASHIIADVLTDGGTPLLWPYPKDFRIDTGLHTGRFLTTIFELGIQICSIAFILMALKSHYLSTLQFSQLPK